MVRLICREHDNTLPAVGATENGTVTMKSFDVNLPEFETWIRSQPEYVHRHFVGIELIEGEAKAR